MIDPPNNHRWKWIQNILNNATVSVVIGILLGWFGTAIYQKFSPAKLNILCEKVYNHYVPQLSWNDSTIEGYIAIYVVTIKNNGLAETSDNIEIEVNYESNGTFPPQHMVISQDVFRKKDLIPRVKVESFKEGNKEGNQVRFLLGELDAGTEYTLTYLAKSISKHISFSAYAKEADPLPIDSVPTSDLQRLAWVANRQLDNCQA